jgi:hypothetical protein
MTPCGSKGVGVVYVLIWYDCDMTDFVHLLVCYNRFPIPQFTPSPKLIL